MSSSLFQVRLNDTDFKVFRSPQSQPPFNPRNCGAVTGQLLSLVTPKVANEMTMYKQGVQLSEWTAYVSSVLGDTVDVVELPTESFLTFFNKNLLPGFGTIALVLPETRYGHYFVVAKSLDGRLVFLDPQIRKGFFSFDEYLTIFQYKIISFNALVRSSPRTATQHISDSTNFIAKALESCNISSGEVYMNVEPPPPKDVVMEGTGRRKRRKTKRRLVAKRTLRRVNRRRRIF